VLSTSKTHLIVKLETFPHLRRARAGFGWGRGAVRPSPNTLLAWLDDLLMHAPEESSLLQALRLFFHLCTDYNIKLHPGVFVLFATLVRWCSRLISFQGVCFDPRRVQALTGIELPSTGADLQQFVCAFD
jgi:hypothetical protein